MARTADFRYMELADSLESRIRQGSYRSGEKLPSIRQLHGHTGLSISTVYQAFIELETRGLVQARPKSGYFVRPLLTGILPLPAPGKPASHPNPVTVGNLALALLDAMGDPEMLQLGGALVAPELLPAKDLADVLKSIPLRSMGNMLAAYENAQGNLELRRQIARRMLAAPLPSGPAEIVVTHGCMEAVALCLKAVAGSGDTIMVESPTFPWFLQVIEDLKMYALEVPTDCQTGIHLKAVARALELHPVRAAVFMANFQNPSGYLMSDARKAQLVDLMSRHGVPVIEDDIYGDLHFGATRPRPLKAFDTKGEVLYCASFSKTMAPGLRVGWTAPGRYLEAVRRVKLNQSIACPSLNQYQAARYLGSGRFDRHLRKLRRALQNQIANTALAVARYFPAGTKISAPQGGITLWVQLPSGVDSLELFRQALDRKVAILPGVICSTGSAYRNCLRVSCGLPWSSRIEDGIQTLGEIIRKISSST